uniref:Uncharacterized protein n=1 Tax=Tetraselmis sp. GSL018 TaxID=582737 RepID=A0A061SH69_9CHLO|mmetsp:Transcript_19331/g.46091  ORF Transcript_19331/g.46091 Transcript_19331/m.46091 type:complete len:399 (-) Transcript_19331:530-1726(-)
MSDRRAGSSELEDEETELRRCALEAAKLSGKSDHRPEASPRPSDAGSDVIVLDSDDEFSGASIAERRQIVTDRLLRISCFGMQSDERSVADRVQEAVEATQSLASGLSIAEWIEAGQQWLIQQSDMELEISQLRAAMAESLQEASNGRGPLENCSDSELQERFKHSAVLKKVGWPADPALRAAMVDFLELERKCKRWWQVDAYFDEFAHQLPSTSEDRSAADGSSSDAPEAEGGPSHHCPSCKDGPGPLTPEPSQGSRHAVPKDGLPEPREAPVGRAGVERRRSPRHATHEKTESEGKGKQAVSVKRQRESAHDAWRGADRRQVLRRAASKHPPAGGSRCYCPAPSGAGAASHRPGSLEQMLSQKAEEIRSHFALVGQEVPEIFRPYTETTAVVDLSC